MLFSICLCFAQIKDGRNAHKFHFPAIRDLFNVYRVNLMLPILISKPQRAQLSFGIAMNDNLNRQILRVHTFHLY